MPKRRKKNFLFQSSFMSRETLVLFSFPSEPVFSSLKLVLFYLFAAEGKQLSLQEWATTSRHLMIGMFLRKHENNSLFPLCPLPEMKINSFP